MTIRIGVMGCASIARRRMLPAMAASPTIKIAAIASRNLDAARTLAQTYGSTAVHGYADLLALHELGIDAVYIPLPAALHAEWAEAALNAGKHVLAEKPLSLAPATTRRLLELAHERGLVLMENVFFVHHGQHRAVRDLVARGDIGEPRSFQAVFTVPRRADDDIRLDPALGGGALFDVGVYPVRAALHFQDLLGGRLSVIGALLTSSGAKIETAGDALLQTAAGIGVHTSFGLDHAYAASYTIHGTESTVTVDKAFTPAADEPPAVRLGTTHLRLPPDDQVANTLEAFAAAVKASRTTPPPPLNDSLLQSQLLDDIRTAAGRTRPHPPSSATSKVPDTQTIPDALNRELIHVPHRSQGECRG